MEDMHMYGSVHNMQRLVTIAALDSDENTDLNFFLPGGIFKKKILAGAAKRRNVRRLDATMVTAKAWRGQTRPKLCGTGFLASCIQSLGQSLWWMLMWFQKSILFLKLSFYYLPWSQITEILLVVKLFKVLVGLEEYAGVCCCMRGRVFHVGMCASPSRLISVWPYWWISI